MDDPADKIIKNYLDGDDVMMIVGVATLGNGIPCAMVVVDYSRCADDKTRDAYTKTMEDSWVEKSFKDGFIVSRTSDDKVRVESKVQMDATIFSGKHQNILRAPAYYADVPGDKEPIDAFFKLKELTKIWVFHIKTMKASYYHIVDENGNIRNSSRRDPTTIKETNG